MNERDTSPWAPPAVEKKLTIEDAYSHELSDEADSDDMRMIVGKRAAKMEYVDAQAPKDVIVTSDQYERFGMIDPETREVTDFMAAHDLSFGDVIRLHVEGEDDVVVATTEKNDFFTRIASESEKLKGQEVLRAEVSHELATEALEATGVASPAETDIVAPEIERSPKNPLLEKLFAPSTRPEVAEGSTYDYDELFLEGAARQAAQGARREREVTNQPVIEAQKNYDRITNDDTRGYSVEQMAAILRRDSKFKAMMAENGFEGASLDSVDALREDPELRYKAGEYLLGKLDKVIAEDKVNGDRSFGERIIRNGQKSNDYLKLPVATTSRQYVAYLALAKLSGMFNYKVDESDIFRDQNDKGDVITNQHRHATDMII